MKTTLRRMPGRVLALLAGLLLAGCHSDTDAHDESPQAVRIVSLAPHLTELAFSAGAGDRLVGVVSYSDYPPAARNLPLVGDAFRLDAERMALLEPSLILAWGGGNPRAVIERLADSGYQVEVFTTQRLSSIADNLRRIGRLAGTSDVARAAGREFDLRLAALRSEYAGQTPVSVFFQIGEQPVFTVSDRHAIGQIVQLCGGRNVFADLPELAASVSDEAVVAADPQVMMAAGDVSSLTHWQRFNGRAVRSGNLFAVDADTITRDSMRILDGAQQMCEQLATARAQISRDDDSTALPNPIPDVRAPVPAQKDNPTGD